MQLFKIKKITIDKSQTNKRLDQVLTKLIGKYSRSQIKILLQNKNVKISNKIIINASYKVKEGEIFNVKIPKITPLNFEPQKIPLNIIYEDNYYILTKNEEKKQVLLLCNSRNLNMIKDIVGTR